MGERRTYHFTGRSGRAIKALHVSPFQSMDREHVLNATPPGERLTVHIESMRRGERVFDATLSFSAAPRASGIA